MRIRRGGHALRRSRPAGHPHPRVARAGARARDPACSCSPCCSAARRASHSSCRPPAPSPSSASLLGGAERTIQQQSVPAIPVPALSFALALGVGLLAVCIDILVQTVRMPALAAAPALVPILIPGFIIEAGAEAPTLVLAAAAYLLLLRVDVRVRRRARHHGRRRGRRCRHGDLPASGADRVDARRHAGARAAPASSSRRCSPPRPRASRRACCSAPEARARSSDGASARSSISGATCAGPIPVRRSTTSRPTASGRTSPCSRSTVSRARRGASPRRRSTATTPSTRCPNPTASRARCRPKSIRST